MSDMPKPVRFGVVTPTLNAEAYLEHTLSSIWSQRSAEIDIDHLIVDGGSTDRTLDVAARYPSRTVVASDGGMYEALNRGMSMITGDIVGYINGDDEIAPGGLAAIADVFRRRPDVQWVCGTVEYLDGDGRTIGHLRPVSLSIRSYVGLGWSCIPQQTVWCRHEFFQRVGPFDATYRNCGDYEWYVRALRLSPVHMMRQTLGRFRLHPAQISLDTENLERESRLIQERNGGGSFSSYAWGRLLSLRLNARNPNFFIGKKTGRLKFKI